MVPASSQLAIARRAETVGRALTPWRTQPGGPRRRAEERACPMAHAAERRARDRVGFSEVRSTESPFAFNAIALLR
jgi:hypothetical protein